MYLEIGKKRAFAGATDWHGWCRSGRDEQAALQALFDYGPRYARVLQGARLGFHAPAKGEISPRGPRGGARWAPRYFVRRVAWHMLDHAREIEDRVVSV
jgi:hypothetical protein